MFAVEEGRVEVLPEHRSAEAFRLYRDLKQRRAVVGMLTFPNAILLRGPRTMVVDPGLSLQNQPLLGALAARGLGPADVDLVALTHAHPDHAAACAELDRQVALHELEIGSGHWPAVAGVLDRRRLVRLRGERGELAPGVRWLRTPGHTEGSVCYLVDTDGGLAALVGDTVGPLREPFDAMTPPDGTAWGRRLLAAWHEIRSEKPDLIVAGHLPPFAP